MKFETFFENFELLTDAPNATVKLRKIILQLAVEGRLLSQNPDDEPTLLLLERIKAHKKRLIEEKKIPKSKNLLPPSLNEFPYKIAKNWYWVRLGEICTKIVDGSHNPPPDQGTGIPMISSQNVLNNEINFSASRYISQEDFEKEMVRTPIEPGDVFLTIVGSIGRSSVVPKTIPNFAIQRSIALIRAEIYPYYLSLFFRSSVAQSYFNQQGKGTAQKGIYLEKLSLLPVAIPPLAEQKRIVEKCDRLLSICDEIEKRHQQRQESIVRMNESAIAQLLSSQNPHEFRQHWQRICNNFDLLYSIPETIPKLRQAILQLAVQGKLVRQEFDDSALRYLIERLTEERLALCPNEKDKQRILSEFEKTLEESAQGKTKDFEIPAICICDFITKGTTPSNSELLPEGEIPYLKVYNIVDNKIDFFYKPTYISTTVHTTKLKRSVVFPGDVLMNIVGPPLAKVAIVPDDFPEWNINQALAIFRPVDSVYNRFIYYALSCYTTLEKVLNETKGTAGQDNLSLEQCRSLRIPLYTIETQKRIVEKCDRLMSLCDTLEAKLKQGRESSEKLMEVAARQVLAN